MHSCDTYYGFLLLIREVLGAMVGFLGAVLGGCCFGCPKQRCLVPWLDLHVRFSMGEVLTAV